MSAITGGRFEGKVVVVTGAGHGIGRASAERFAQEGAEVIAVDLNPAAAAETVRLVSDRGGVARAIVADVADETAVETLGSDVRTSYGHVDVVHNNAGRLTAGSVIELPVEEWDRTFAVNVRSMFLVCRTLIPLMRAGGGAIVNTASTSGLVGSARTPAYDASKAAVINLTRQLAADYSRENIRVNCVCPGWVPTGFNDPVVDGLEVEEFDAMIRANVPLGREAMVEEIATAVAFLASDDASYIAGHALVVDGGLTACR